MDVNNNILIIKIPIHFGLNITFLSFQMYQMPDCFPKHMHVFTVPKFDLDDSSYIASRDTYVFCGQLPPWSFYSHHSVAFIHVLDPHAKFLLMYQAMQAKLLRTEVSVKYVPPDKYLIESKRYFLSDPMTPLFKFEDFTVYHFLVRVGIIKRQGISVYPMRRAGGILYIYNGPNAMSPPIAIVKYGSASGSTRCTTFQCYLLFEYDDRQSLIAFKVQPQSFLCRGTYFLRHHYIRYCLKTQK